VEREKTYDIKWVCEKYNVSSRTLRYYEEEGLIESARDGSSKRRRYIDSQTERLELILTLRAVGLSIKQIKEYVCGNETLYEIASLRKAEIEASIAAKYREIKYLNRLLNAIEDGKEPLKEIGNQNIPQESELFEIARTCSDSIIKGDYETLYSFFSQKMKEYMPVDSFKIIWKDTVAGMGAFEKLGNTYRQDEIDYVIYQDLIYENMVVQLKYVFYGTVIHGLWMNYIEKGKGQA